MEAINLEELKKTLTRIVVNQQKIAESIEAHQHDREGYSYSPKIWGNNLNTIYLEDIENIFSKDEKAE